MAKKKAKQTKIPGTERTDTHPDIESAATKYVEIRDERMELTKREVAAKQILLEAMQKHKLKTYRCEEEELEVLIIPAKDEKIKVKRIDADEDDVDFENDGKADPEL